MAIPSFFRQTSLAAAAVSAAFALAPSGVARADGPSAISAQACIDANAKAQELRRDGKLGAARVELNRCVNRACPGMVRDDCARRLDEVDRVQPTVVFSAKDGDGNDISAVTVSVDGRKLAEHLDGTALAVDPGAHTFTFESSSQPPVTRRFVVHEGEKGRIESIVIGTPTARASSTPATTTLAATPLATTPVVGSPPPSDVKSGQAQRLGGFVVGGVGVAGLAAGGVFGFLAMSKWHDSQNECGAVCLQQNRPAAVSDHDKAVTFGSVSTAAFIGGGVLLVTGGVLVLTAPHGRSETAWSLSPRIGPGMADLSLTGEF
jgi:hypothetical protein